MFVLVSSSYTGSSDVLALRLTLLGVITDFEKIWPVPLDVSKLILLDNP